jgi:hypothetical protein
MVETAPIGNRDVAGPRGGQMSDHVEEPSEDSTVNDWFRQNVARDQELADELVAEEDGDLDAAEERFQEGAKGRDTYEAGHPRPS